MKILNVNNKFLLFCYNISFFKRMNKRSTICTNLYDWPYEMKINIDGYYKDFYFFIWLDDLEDNAK